MNQHLFFQVYVEKEIGNSFDGLFSKEELLNIDTSKTGQFNVLLNTNNWNKHKDDFYTQRISSYKDSYTLDEKIKLELEALETIQFEKRDNKVLADRYKTLLESKKNLQIETDKTNVVKKELHNNIFKGNAFELFEKYHITKNLTGSSRADYRLLFELLKEDELIHSTIELKHYKEWLNNTYEYAFPELRIIDIKSRPNIQRTNDYKEYKKATLK
jgi:hypothetical protein